MDETIFPFRWRKAASGLIQIQSGRMQSTEPSFTLHASKILSGRGSPHHSSVRLDLELMEAD